MGKSRRGDGGMFNFNFDFSSLQLNPMSGQAEEDKTEFPRINQVPVNYVNAEELARKIRWGQNVFSIVSGSFVYGDFLEAWIDTQGIKVNNMYVSTLGLSKENADSLASIVRTLGCEHLDLVISNYFVAMKKKEILPHMLEQFRGLPIDVSVLASHMKIVVIETDRGTAIMHGSANLSSSNNLEQFSLTFDEPELSGYMTRKFEMVRSRFCIFHGETDTEYDWNKNKGNTGMSTWAAWTETEINAKKGSRQKEMAALQERAADWREPILDQLYAAESKEDFDRIYRGGAV